MARWGARRADHESLWPQRRAGQSSCCRQIGLRNDGPGTNIARKSQLQQVPAEIRRGWLSVYRFPGRAGDHQGHQRSGQGEDALCEVRGALMIYLDNAATSFPKPESVYAAMDRCARTQLANPGRAGHKMALAAERLLDDGRHRLNQFFHGAAPERFI